MKKYFTTHEVAEMCQVSRGSVIRWIREGKILAATTFGGHNRISFADAQKLLKELGLPFQQEELKCPEAKRPRILIVDDEKTFCDMLEKYLRSIFPEAQIEKAFDGFEAGMKVEKWKPDAVILDLMLPGLDGFRVCDLIREQHSSLKIKIIAITGYDDQMYRDKILSLGADDFLSKPFSLEVLRDKLQTYAAFASEKQGRLRAS